MFIAFAFCKFKLTRVMSKPWHGVMSKPWHRGHVTKFCPEVGIIPWLRAILVTRRPPRAAERFSLEHAYIKSRYPTQ